MRKLVRILFYVVLTPFAPILLLLFFLKEHIIEATEIGFALLFILGMPWLLGNWATSTKIIILCSEIATPLIITGLYFGLRALYNWAFEGRSM